MQLDTSDYLAFWGKPLLGLTVELWVNDLLMAIFFLLVGLELEREIYSGELSQLRKALLPAFAAIGGMCAPAAIHFALNSATPTQAGFGIPMATDIAFSIAILALLGRRVPAALKVFVVAYAVIDDLGAIVLIATVFTAHLSWVHLAGAVMVWLALIGFNRLRVMALWPYVLGGALIWFLLLKSGVHATIAGVALAFAIPYTAKDEDSTSPSHRLEGFLHKPVALLVLPIFALANTAIVIPVAWSDALLSANSMGIVAGLVVGKPLGVVLVCWLAVKLGLARLPEGLNWLHIVGAGLLGGIGFTMSIFIANLAFMHQTALIDTSKMAILVASVLAAAASFYWLRWVCAKPLPT